MQKSGREGACPKSLEEVVVGPRKGFPRQKVSPLGCASLPWSSKWPKAGPVYILGPKVGVAYMLGAIGFCFTGPCHPKKGGC